MKQYIGYIRVSTVKQGTQGVSLQEQRDAITRYAERHRLHIVRWLEEQQTAAKKGRPVFNLMLKLLRQGAAHGVILHKLDRGTRNLRDWTDISELSDQGVESHCANESLDLHSRGGRLSADIQAVVAADMIRNLREETRKGFYGRLKQGLYPLSAPLGYLDQGKGKPKTIDPFKGPLVRMLFELYATANHSLETVGEEMFRLGLRNRNGGKVTRNGLSTLLNNPFYMGLIRIRRTNENFAGIHEALISKSLFDRVAAVLAGKINRRTERHNFLFRRLLTCATCGYSLIGERTKGHAYYRCHTKHTPPTSLREESVESQVAELLQCLRFNEKEKAYFTARIMTLRESWAEQKEVAASAIKLKLPQLKDRLNRLTDAYLDQIIDKTLFEDRKSSLLMEQKILEENLNAFAQDTNRLPDRLTQFLELAENAQQSYELAFPEEKRDLIQILTSNRIIDGKQVTLEPSIPFAEVINRFKNDGCDLHRDIPRTWDRLLAVLTRLDENGLLGILTPRTLAEATQNRAI